ncbi:MAG: fluoride efflux transporter CrcB [Chroococcidiopsidaceae cyanobacterium CP_BM_ER_R8_30]|nr:fluoride efflux transporter CrcB [Chroococcidiopsidaceae cyanobacterium CP_BM_ER_R8_30]
MLASVLQQLFNELGRAVGMLSSVDPAIRAPLAVSLGAVPGALSRYYLTLLFAHWLGSSFPYGTFIINLSGALIMGFFSTLALERALIPPDLRLLVAVGFLGSYTTFSTYALDTATLLRVGSQSPALFYWAGSAVLGVLSLELGSFLARRLL